MTKAPKPKRWLTQHLPVSHRHSIQYDYYVTGHGPFPVDMLRHDCAWPLTGEDAAKMEWSFIREDRMKTISIKLRSHRAPTIDRWSSFNWSVGIESLEPRADPVIQNIVNEIREIADEVEAASREFRPTRT